MYDIVREGPFLLFPPEFTMKYSNWLSARGAKKNSAGVSKLPDFDHIRDLLEKELGVIVPRREVDFDWDCDFSDLMPYQVSAIIHHLSTPWRGALLNLAQGLGKTAVACRLLDALKPKRALVVTSKALHFDTWQAEAKTWIDAGFTSCHGTKPSGDWVLTNLGTLKGRWASSYLAKPWDVVIFDESSNLKNRDSQAAKAALAVRRKAIWCFLLSGTPVTRQMDDLWAQLHLIFPQGFPSYWRFVEEFCYVDKNVWGSEIKGPKPFDFSKVFGDIIYTVDQDVLDLPQYETSTEVVTLAPKQAESYRALWEEYRLESDQGVELDMASALARLTRLLQIASTPRVVFEDWTELPAKLVRLEEILKRPETQFPLIVWYYWVGAGDLIEERLTEAFPDKRVARLNKSNLSHLVDEFREGKIDIFIISLSVGNEGIHLIETRTVIYYDLTYRWGYFAQSLLRVRRIGLQHSPKLIFLISKGTEEARLSRNLQQKSILGANYSNRIVEALSAHLTDPLELD